MKKIAIGISDFEKLITGNYYYVDKSLLIKEILDLGAAATLIPRPRRFGKTLNLSMLKYFFEIPINNHDKKFLFNDLKIATYPDVMVHQGQYPVIFISLKDAKASTWEQCYAFLLMLIRSEFERHSYLKDSVVLSAEQRASFASVLSAQAQPAVYNSALKDLSHYLMLFHKKKPIILIDEYDSPIHAGFVNKYYHEVIEFMRSFLGFGLKDNLFLNFSVMTGILRVARESIFSGLNNLSVCTLLSDHYADKFGFVAEEVQQLLNDFNLSLAMDQVKHWYDGYTVGKQSGIYNPWSIINFVSNKGEFRPYWVNTSDNAIIKELIVSGSVELRMELEHLLSGGFLEKRIDENIVFGVLHTREESLWSFLLLTGYLAADDVVTAGIHVVGKLRLPNLEVTSFYETAILEWLESKVNVRYYQKMLQELVGGDIEEFKDFFYDIVRASLSSFDTGGDQPERFYHALVLGMLVSLRDRHEVSSNQESGYGRYDVMIIPKNPAKDSCGVIIEFKRKTDRYKTLELAAQAALMQIEDRHYATRLSEIGVQKIVKLAIVFDGKKVLVQEG